MGGSRVGQWEVLGELARGGQGVVLRARHAVHGTPAALKLLLRVELKTVLRFRQEAAVLLRLNHPNLVRVLEVGEHEGAPFLAMELVVGQSLADLVREGGPPPFERTAKLLAAVARAVHHCHASGVVHRDLKPENVIVERDTGRAVLVDFGMVKRDRELFGALSIDELTRLSRTGELRGTPMYMAPEQVTSQGEVGPWTDVHALGALLHVLLTGEPPYAAESLVQLLQALASGAPRDPRDLNPAVPAALAQLSLSALAKARDERPASAAAFADALEAALAPPARRSVSPALVVAGLLAVAGGGAASAVATRGRAAMPAPAPAPATPSAAASAAPGPEAAVAMDPADDTPSPDLAEAEEVLDLAARGDIAAARARAERLRGAAPMRRGTFIRAVLSRLDVPQAPLLDGVAAALVELRLAARELEATGAERAALRARLAALVLGEAEPEELARLGTQAARCRAAPPLALLERACAAHPSDGALAVARLKALWRSGTGEQRPVDQVAAGLERLPPGAPGAERDLLAARVAVARGEVDRALALLAEPARTPEAAADRAGLLHRAGRTDEARAELGAGISADPSAPTFRVVRVLIAFEQAGVLADPHEDIRAALAADPWHTEAFELQGKLALVGNDPRAARDAIRRLARVGDRERLAGAWSIQYADGVLRSRGSGRLGGLLLAAAAGERLDRVGAPLPLSREVLSRELEAATPASRGREAARAAIGAGAAATALRLLDHLAAEGDDLPEDADLRLLGYLLQGSLDEAREAAARAVARWPGAAAPIAALAMVDHLHRRDEEARRRVDEALRLDPGAARALHVRARLHRAEQDPAGALSDLRAAGAAAPDDPWIGADLGRALLEARQRDEGLRALRRAREAAPGWWHAFYLEALAELDALRPGQALTLCGAALLADDRPAEVWVLRARARVALGDPLGALEDLEAATHGDAPRSVEGRATAVDARVQSGDVAGALEVVEQAPAHERERLAQQCESFARRAWWTDAERARLARLLHR